MTELMTFAADEVAPGREAVYELQGIPAGREVQGQAEALCTAALGLLSELAAPAGIIAEVSQAEFEAVYHGEGRNEASTPVGDIFNRAEHLALFAVTLGEEISREITERFRSNDFALGCMLDSVASAAADKLAELVESRFFGALRAEGKTTSGSGAMRYSPGYCGWHVSGQKKLFEVLRPERIGISLGPSFLMQPLKSVSGVIMAGPKEMHCFDDAYPFCERCETHDCRERIRALLGD